METEEKDMKVKIMVADSYMSNLGLLPVAIKGLVFLYVGRSILRLHLRISHLLCTRF